MTAKKPIPTGGPNAEALEATLEELRRMGRLEPVDAALVQMCRSMAGSLDAKPWNSQMFKEYRETLGVLIAHGDDGTGDLEALLQQLQAPVGDTPPS